MLISYMLVIKRHSKIMYL